MTPAGRIVGRDHAGPKRKLADSQKEYRRLLELQALERAGAIHQLRSQVAYWLTKRGQKIGRIVIDFRYIRGGVMVFEDVKSPATITALFKWKAKHFTAQTGFPIRIQM